MSGIHFLITPCVHRSIWEGGGSAPRRLEGQEIADPWCCVSRPAVVVHPPTAQRGHDRRPRLFCGRRRTRQLVAQPRCALRGVDGVLVEPGHRHIRVQPNRKRAEPRFPRHWQLDRLQSRHQRLEPSRRAKLLTDALSIAQVLV